MISAVQNGGKSSYDSHGRSCEHLFMSVLLSLPYPSFYPRSACAYCNLQPFQKAPSCSMLYKFTVNFSMPWFSLNLHKKRKSCRNHYQAVLNRMDYNRIRKANFEISAESKKRRKIKVCEQKEFEWQAEANHY